MVFRISEKCFALTMFLMSVWSSQCPDLVPCSCTTDITKNKNSALSIDCSNIIFVNNLNFTKLKGLSINQLLLRNISVNKLPPYSFEGLKIKILDLSENSIDNLDQIFTKLDTDLKEINLNNANVDYDVLKILGRFKNLTHLSLSHNEILARELPHKVLADLLDLEYLDLSENNFRFADDLKELPGLTNLIFLSLRETNLNLRNKDSLRFLKNLISLEELNLNSNVDGAFTLGSIFKNLNLFSLKRLNLQSNHIAKMQDDTFKDIENLQILDLSDNILPMVPFALTSTLSNLTHLNVSSNNIHYILDNTFENMTKLTYLNLHNNRLESFPKNSFRGLGNRLHTLDLSSNNLTGGHFWVAGLRPLRSLLKLNISHNRLQHIQNDSFDTTAYLQELDVSDNPLLFTDTMFNGIEFSLKKLYMKDIGMKRVPLNSLETISGFEILDLSNNKMVKLNSMFLKGVNTRLLYLQNMSISEITIDAFIGMRGPLSVFLDDNKIKSLRFLNTSAPCLYRTVSLINNPIVCDCIALSVSASGRIGNVSGTCVNNDFYGISLQNISTSLTTFTRLCGQLNIASGHCSSTGKFISNSATYQHGHLFITMFVLVCLLIH